jgi:hypothetical protein
MLSPEAQQALEQLAKVHGSKAKAVNAAIISVARERELAEKGKQAVSQRLVIGEDALSNAQGDGAGTKKATKSTQKPSEPKDKPAPMGRLKGHWKAP